MTFLAAEVAQAASVLSESKKMYGPRLCFLHERWMFLEIGVSFFTFFWFPRVETWPMTWMIAWVPHFRKPQCSEIRFVCCSNTNPQAFIGDNISSLWDSLRKYQARSVPLGGFREYWSHLFTIDHLKWELTIYHDNFMIYPCQSLSKNGTLAQSPMNQSVWAAASTGHANFAIKIIPGWSDIGIGISMGLWVFLGNDVYTNGGFSYPCHVSLQRNISLIGELGHSVMLPVKLPATWYQHLHHLTRARLTHWLREGIQDSRTLEAAASHHFTQQNGLTSLMTVCLVVFRKYPPYKISQMDLSWFVPTVE